MTKGFHQFAANAANNNTVFLQEFHLQELLFMTKKLTSFTAFYFLLCFSGSISVTAAVHDTTRILFIGNSITYVHDVPGLVKSLADAAGYPVVFTMHAPPGATVGDVAQDTYAHMNNPAVFELIRKGNWDYVSVQDNQGRLIFGGCKFPSTVNSKVIEGHGKIRDSVLYYNPCARMIWYSAWAWKNGYPPYGNTGQQLIEQIFYNLKCINQLYPEIIAPIGSAWIRSMAALPQTDLWGTDDTHQSLAGSYLTASVIFSTIFRTRMDDNPFNAGIDAAVAKTMRQIAYETVVDSFSATNLDSYCPVLQLAGSQLTAPAGFTNYKWFKDNTLISDGTSNTFGISGSGSYQVIMTSNDNCITYSLAYDINPTHTGALIAPGFKVYPLPAHNEINIKFSMRANWQIYLRDAIGRLVQSGEYVQDKITLSTATLNPGIYFLSVSNDTQQYSMKIVKE